jgi:hypothetical protein
MHLSKDIEPIKEETSLSRSQIAFRRLARDFTILQTGLQALEEDLLGIAEVLNIPIERVPSIPRVQEPSQPASPPLGSETRPRPSGKT